MINLKIVELKRLEFKFWAANVAYPGKVLKSIEKLNYSRLHCNESHFARKSPNNAFDKNDRQFEKFFLHWFLGEIFLILQKKKF